MTTAGVLTPIANGFNEARGITVGADGNVYVAHYGAGEVVQVNPNAAIGSKTANSAAINSAYGIITTG